MKLFSNFQEQSSRILCTYPSKLKSCYYFPLLLSMDWCWDTIAVLFILKSSNTYDVTKIFSNIYCMRENITGTLGTLHNLHVRPRQAWSRCVPCVKQENLDFPTDRRHGYTRVLTWLVMCKTGKSWLPTRLTAWVHSKADLARHVWNRKILIPPRQTAWAHSTRTRLVMHWSWVVTACWVRFLYSSSWSDCNSKLTCRYGMPLQHPSQYTSCPSPSPFNPAKVRQDADQGQSSSLWPLFYPPFPRSIHVFFRAYVRVFTTVSALLSSAEYCVKPKSGRKRKRQTVQKYHYLALCISWRNLKSGCIL